MLLAMINSPTVRPTGVPASSAMMPTKNKSGTMAAAVIAAAILSNQLTILPIIKLSLRDSSSTSVIPPIFEPIM